MTKTLLLVGLLTVMTLLLSCAPDEANNNVEQLQDERGLNATSNPTDFIGCNDTGPNAHPFDPRIPVPNTSQPRYDGQWDWMFLINLKEGWASWLTSKGDPGQYGSPHRVPIQRLQPSINFGFTTFSGDKGFKLHVSLNMLNGRAKITGSLGDQAETYDAACRMLFSNPLKQKTDGSNR